jgi:hypothetical protein
MDSSRHTEHCIIRFLCAEGARPAFIHSFVVTNWFSQTQQSNYDKGGQGYMFRSRFEVIFRLFVVEQLIKFLHTDVSVLWDPKQLYRVIKIHEFTKSVYIPYSIILE